MVVTLLGHHIVDFYVGLVTLGIGWNLSFVSSTMLLLASHTLEERTKVTAFNETLRFVANGIATILSSTLTWDDLSYTCLGCSVPLSAVALLTLIRSRQAS